MTRTMSIGGVPIRDTSSSALVRFLGRLNFTTRPVIVGFVNHNFVVRCQDLCRLTTGSKGILLVNDGVGVEIAAFLTYRRGFNENMNGTDFLPLFLAKAKPELRIYLLGGAVETLQEAARMIDSLPRRRVVGRWDGVSVWAKEADVIRDINASRPDVLLVGFGNPLQERWILKHRNALDVSIVFAVGALFEWMTGRRHRAPLFVRRLRLEWLYRLMLEPKRLAKRYTLDVVRFFTLVHRHK